MFRKRRNDRPTSHTDANRADTFDDEYPKTIVSG
jgi:hypothetical protein